MRRRDILSYVQAHPGCSTNAIHGAVIGTWYAVVGALQELERSGAVCNRGSGETRGATRWYAHDATPQREDCAAPDEPAPEPEPDPLAERAEKRQLKALLDERRKLLDLVEEERERSKFAAAIADAQLEREPYRIERRERASGLREGILVALFSDAHLEETVDERKVGGRNRYDLQVAERRCRRFASAVVWLLDYHRAGGYAIRELVLSLLGDLISGWIHDELKETNQLAPLPAALFAFEQVSRILRTILAETDLDLVTIPVNYGNHSRLTKRKQAKNRAETSLEWMLGAQLEHEFRDEPRVRFDRAYGGSVWVDAYQWTLHFTHGDDVKYAGGIGGLDVPLRKALVRWESLRSTDFHHVGHFHEWGLTGRRCFRNGSLIGFSEFGVGRFEFQEPEQFCYLLDSRKGPCMPTPIWVDGATDDEAADPTRRDPPAGRASAPPSAPDTDRAPPLAPLRPCSPARWESCA